MRKVKIKFGIREIEIPELALRQRRVVVPLLIKLAPTMKRISETKTTASITTEEYGDIQEVVYQGFTRAEPKLQREAFLDFVADEKDLLGAYYAIVMLVTPDEPLGEAQGEKQNSPTTGTNTSTMS